MSPGWPIHHGRNEALTEVSNNIGWERAQMLLTMSNTRNGAGFRAGGEGKGNERE